MSITQNGQARQKGFGAFNGNIPARFKGKKVKLEGYLKTDAVKDNYGGLYLRVDGTRAFDNMRDRGVTGTTDWRKYSIELIPVLPNRTA